MAEIVIDQEFEASIPPLSEQELELLEQSVLADGCRDALVVWADENILLDGHHRHRICAANSIPFNVAPLAIVNREAALDWIDANQLGRRNLTPDQASLLRGRRYNRVKKGAHDGGKGKIRSGPQNEDHLKTAERLATQHGVSRATIERDGQFARAVEKAKETEPELERRVIKGQGPPKAAILKAAEILEREPEKARAILRGELKMAHVVREMKREDIKRELEDIRTMATKGFEGVFDVIVIDPPWPMKKIERNERPTQVEFDYPTMTENELYNLNIPTADNCHVWLWTTQRFLPMAFRLLDAWGLRYLCTFVWHKPGGFQPVNLPQYNCEFALYARSGSPEFLDTTALPTCFEAPRGKHSEKPAEFYEVVRRITAGRRLDMFARKERDGFSVWGNEVG